MDPVGVVHYVKKANFTSNDYVGRVEMRLGKTLCRLERNNDTFSLDSDIGRKITSEIFMFVLSLIHNRGTLTRMIYIEFYKDDNDPIVGETVYNKRFKKIRFNVCKISGLIQFLGIMLHKLIHVLCLSQTEDILLNIFIEILSQFWNL